MRRRALLLLVAGATLLTLLGGVAEGSHACATYDVTAPVIGRKTDTKCSPVPLPPSFNQPITVYRCQWIPPIGYSSCVTVGLHVPPV